VDNASSPFISHNNITQNDGIGIAVLSGSSPTIVNNMVSANVASNEMFSGAGIYSEMSSPTIENNTVSDNIDNVWGNTYGIFAADGPVIITNNTVTGHKDAFGYVCGLGMALFSCGGAVSGNNISGNDNGIALQMSDLLVENNWIGDTDENMGIGLLDNSAATCQNNTYFNNVYGVMLEQDSTSAHDNEIFASNDEGIDGDGQVSQFQNTFTDCIFTDNGRDAALTAPWGLRAGGTVTLIRPCYDPEKVVVSDGNSMLMVMWNLKIKVEFASDGRPAADARVGITEAQGKELEPLTTGPDGWTDMLLLEEYRYMGSFKRTSSPFNITAVSGDFISSIPKFCLNCSGELTILLDDVLPELAIFSPANGTITNRTAVAVTGQCEPGALLRVNEMLVPLEQDGLWSVLVELPFEGANDIVVEAQDAMENTVRRSIIILRDTVVPVIQLDSPADHFLVNTTTMNVSGVLSEPEANLTIDGKVVAAGLDGRFSIVLELTEGRNTIELKVTDHANNTAVLVLQGTVDTVLPFVRVVEPANGAATNASKIMVIGQVEAYATIVMNGLPLLVNGTSFEILLELEEGENVFVFAARDRAGNMNTTVLMVMRDSVPPAVNVSSPVSGEKLNRSNVEVAGSTEPDASVWVNGKATETTEGAFNVELTLKEGANDIVIEARDALGNLERRVLSVLVDTVPPTLSILGPANRTLYNRTAIEVYGMTEPGASVLIDSQLTVGNAQGRFSALVGVPQEGENNVQVSAWDSLFNTAELRITIFRDTFASFHIASPASGAKVQGGTVTITGTAEPNSTIWIADEEVQQGANGSFSASVKLASDQNTITVVVRDAAGNTGSMNLTVVRVADSNGQGGPALPVIIGAAVLVVACVGIAVAMYVRRKA
jgi:parallel beta-helix repeat protein